MSGRPLPVAPEEARSLLLALWEPMDPPGFVEWRPLYPEHLPQGDPRRVVQGRARRWLTLADAVRRLPAYVGWCAHEGLGAYFGVLPRQVYGSGTAEHVTVGAVAWVDIDARVKLAREALRELLFAPSAIVHTGRGVHAYWLLSEPHEATTCARLSGQLAELVDGDRTSDPARLLRLPGSRNTKHDGSPLARLKLLDLGRRYHAEDLRDWLDEMAPIKAPKPITGKRSIAPGQLGLVLEKRRRAAPRIAQAALDRVRRATPGQRTPTLFRAACDLGRVSSTGVDVGPLAEDLVRAAVGLGLDSDHARRTVGNGIEHGHAGSWDYGLPSKARSTEEVRVASVVTGGPLRAEPQHSDESGPRRSNSDGPQVGSSRLSRAGTPQVVTGKHR